VPHHGCLMQYLRMTYVNVQEYPNYFPDYYKQLCWARTVLTHEEWCSLFVGPCNISFQVFDSEAMRNIYCEECAGWPNYARDPSKWKKAEK
ncbi:MAG: hypothetical protein ACRCYO_00210, partial [Bacteroidia bacterium]